MREVRMAAAMIRTGCLVIDTEARSREMTDEQWERFTQERA